MHATAAPKLLLTSALTLSLALAASTAFGGMAGETVRIETTLVMKETFPAFHGKVKADNDACVGQRTVKLFEKKFGGGKELLGKDTTSSSGRWKVIVDPLASGAYFSTVKKVVQGTAGTIYECTRDKSQVATVD